MLEPFVWMFKVAGIKKHFIYLYSVFFIFFVLYFAIVYLSNSIDCCLFFKSLIPVLFGLGLLLVFLFFQGYFFELVGNIISRDWDIKADNVYNSKVKTIFKISLPELHFFKILWRGIASFFAMVLMVLPFILLVTTSNAVTVLSNFSNIGVIIIYLFLSLFFPALLWNYSIRNSIVAVFNYRKAIYIMGNYTFTYFKNLVIFIVYFLLDGFVMEFIVNIFAKNKIFFAEFHSINLAYSLILLFIFFTNYIYSLYVFAYLLGTFAPSEEV